MIIFAGGAVARASTTVVAWGDNSSLQVQVPAGLTNAIAVAAGYQHSLALKGDGTVTGWGYNFFGQATAPASLSNVVAVAAGYSHSVALKADGSVVVWGSQSAVPADLTNAIAIAAGWDHNLAARSDGSVVSWGSQTNVPPGLNTVVGVAAGNGQSMALLFNGTVVAWGDNSFGKTNVPAGLTNVVAIAAGADHCLALRRNGTIVAWGANTSGQTSVPSSATNIAGISAGAAHNLTLKSDGTLVAWGDNSFGQSTVVPSIIGVVSVAAGGGHSLAVRGSGAPAITVQPLSQSVILSRTAAFQVVAAGTQPITYQWARNGTNILNATNSSLSISNVQTNDAGAYSVLVANFAGSVNSSNALLTPVGAAPLILTQPQDLSIFCGDAALFKVVPDGTAPLRYQWSYQGAPIAGATRSTLSLPLVNPVQAGGYSVVITNGYGAITSVTAQLTVPIEPPFITSPLTASGKQGVPFAYTITALHSPSGFSTLDLPPGLTLDTTNGIITGAPLESGVFGPLIATVNACSSDVETLVLTITSSIPVITSPLTVTPVEEAQFTYQVTATDSPTSYDAKDLPLGLSINPATGLITGHSVYAGDFHSTLFASNVWGVGSASLHLIVTNAPIQFLSIANVSYNYSSPYLLDFEFSLRDDNDPNKGHAVVADPRLLSVVCKEDDLAISPTETAFIVDRGTSKLMKSYLVLDYTESIASLSNGDANGDGISDAVDQVTTGAKIFVNSQSPESQIGVYEFHREDVDPQKVIGLTTDKAALDQAIDGIWTNYVQWFPAASRCWDATVAAINAIGASNRDEQHYVILVSDGKDESSFSTGGDVIAAANNNNVKVYAIGFGAELDTFALLNITVQTGGRYYEATNVAEISAQFAEISKDLNSQYLLRWATLKRSTNSFQPSFQVAYQGLIALSPTNPIITTTNITPPATNPPPPVTNIIIAPYTPTQHTGTVTVGSLRFVANAEVLPKSVTLRATYVPRYIRQLHLHYRPNWPSTATLMSTNAGEIMYGWSLIETNDGSGGKWLQLLSPYPASLTNSIPFGALGNLVKFTLRDMVDATNAFSFFDSDNTIYTNTGGQRFVFENTNLFFTSYVALPFGTPVPWLLQHSFSGNLTAAEISDPDNDGVLTWQEYQANTDPQDPASKFVIRSVVKGSDGRHQITFSTSTARSYRVLASSDLVNWQIVEENIEGIGADVTVTDDRFIPGTTQMYYRVQVY
jgi:hypothetical protein